MPAATFATSRLQELLNAAITALEQSRITNAPPARTLRTHNRPAVAAACSDDLLAVYLADPAVMTSPTSQKRATAGGPVRVVPWLRLMVELWRCTPGLDPFGNEPTVTALDNSAAGLSTDMWALYTGLSQDIDAGTLFTSQVPGVRPSLGDPVPLGPQGRMGGWRILVEVPVGDFGPIQ